MKQTGLDRETPPQRAIPITISNTFVLAVFTACIGFAAPRLYGFVMDQTADSAARVTASQAADQTRALLIAARDRQILEIEATMESNYSKLDRRVQSLEEWAREKRLR